MNISLSNLLAPHYCTSCGEIGDVLCEYCKYDIVEDRYAQCIVCRRIVNGNTNLCSSCQEPFVRAWCVGERQETLRTLIDNLKFERARVVYKACGDLLDRVIPVLPPNTVVTYVTTAAPDIRRRGYDHAALIAQDFAKRRHLTLARTIDRPVYRRQFGASRRERIANAKESIVVTKTLSPVPYLLIDDVYTTGATLARASAELQRAGAREVYAAVIARQPLEKLTHI